MTNLKNELPVAVHIASGGDARVRTGGTAIPLNGVSSGSFLVQNGTRYKLIVNIRTAPGVFVVVGYAGPVGLSNASYILADGQSVEDNVPEGTTIHFAVLDGFGFLPTPGGTDDYLYISFYG